MAEQQGNDNSADNLLWGVVGGGIAIGLIWVAFHFHIALGYLYLSDFKLTAVEWFVGLFGDPGSYLYELRQWINTADPRTMGIADIMELNRSVSFFYALPITLLLLIWGYTLYKKPTYTRNLSTEDLVESESELWPFITPAMVDNIMDEDPMTGKWAVARSPVEFIEHFGLVDSNGKIIRKKAEKVFLKQLGKPFDGLKSLNKYELALFGCFSAAIMENKEEAQEAAAIIAQSYDGKTVNCEPGIALAKKYIKEEKIQNIIHRHFYKNTVMYEMLYQAREESGVFPSAFFIWLRPLNRHTWYILNNVGRRVTWADSAAIFGHWNAEKIWGAAIPKPYLVKTIDGLEKVTRERVIKPGK